MSGTWAGCDGTFSSLSPPSSRTLIYQSNKSISQTNKRCRYLVDSTSTCFTICVFSGCIWHVVVHGRYVLIKNVPCLERGRSRRVTVHNKGSPRQVLLYVCVYACMCVNVCAFIYVCICLYVWTYTIYAFNQLRLNTFYEIKLFFCGLKKANIKLLRHSF